MNSGDVGHGPKGIMGKKSKKNGSMDKTCFIKRCFTNPCFINPFFNLINVLSIQVALGPCFRSISGRMLDASRVWRTDDGDPVTLFCSVEVEVISIDHEQSLFFLGPSSKTPETCK